MESRGWSLFVHPLFQAQVEKLASRDPDGYASHPAAKTLAAILYSVEEAESLRVPSREYAWGAGNRHWFRAKSHGRRRLFYRFSGERKAIVYAWVDDDKSLRKAGSKA